MEHNDIKTMVDLAIEYTDLLDPEEWPLEELDELCLQIVPDGTQVHALCSSSFRLEKSGGKGAEGANYEAEQTVGSIALIGYFRGLQILTYLDVSVPSIEVEHSVLTLRLDSATDEMHLIPITSIMGFEVDDTDPFDVLEYEDGLENIDVLTCNQSIDFVGLSQLFGNLDPSDIKTSLYLKHLNNTLSLNELFGAVLAKSFIYFDVDGVIQEISEQPKLIELEPGKSFTILQTVSAQGEQETVLCVNGLKDSMLPVKVPINSIERILGK